MTLAPVEADLVVRTVDGVEPALAVRRFGLVEGLDQPAELVAALDVPFEASLEVVTDDLALDVRGLLGGRASVELTRPGITSRVWHGVVTRSEYVTTRRKQLFAQVVVEPSLALLRYSRRRRIYADRTLPEVLTIVCADVFEAHGGAWDFGRITTEFQPRDYVVQYDETDLAFVLRLLSDAGFVVLCGEGEGEGETTYAVVDGASMLPGLGVEPVDPSSSDPTFVSFVPDAEEEADAPSVQYLGRVDHVRPARSVVAARDWKTPKGSTFGTSVEGETNRGCEGQVWTYHPGRLDEGQGSEGAHVDATPRWAGRIDDDHRAAGVEAMGASNIVDMSAGGTFELNGHPHPDLDQPYAVTGVVHRGDFPEVELDGSSFGHSTYTNRFAAQPLLLPVRPRLRARPQVAGLEAATVVGPEGEEIHTDALGRVRVSFHWDADVGATCWLRVMTAWAGPGYGLSAIPRVGMEVVVSFLGGNVDRPMIVGCIPTGTNVPPGALPETRTQTTLKTRSSPNGEGFNELRFEDASGSEEIYMHAQRSRRTVVRASDSTRVGGSRTLSVRGGSSRSIDGDENVVIGRLNESIANLDVKVTGGEMRDIGEVHSLHAVKGAYWTCEGPIVGSAEGRVEWSCVPRHKGLAFPASGGTVFTLTPKTAKLEALEAIELCVGKTLLRLTPEGIEIEAAKLTADIGQQLWLAAPGGRISLNEKRAEVFGGPKSESTVRLSADKAELTAKRLLKQHGKSVTVVADDKVRIESSETSVAAKTVALEAETSMSLTTPGQTTITGMPIRLN